MKMFDDWLEAMEQDLSNHGEIFLEQVQGLWCSKSRPVNSPTKNVWLLFFIPPIGKIVKSPQGQCPMTSNYKTSRFGSKATISQNITGSWEGRQAFQLIAKNWAEDVTDDKYSVAPLQALPYY